MRMFYQGQEIHVGAMQVYRNQDIYRIEDMDVSDEDRNWGYSRDPLGAGTTNSDLYTQWTVPARPDETNYQFKKIEVSIGGKTRVFGVGRLVDFLQGSSLGTKHLTLDANGEIASANGSSHYKMNNAVKGSADMRRIWVNSGPGKDFAGYWTLHEYRTEDVMTGPGWDEHPYEQQVQTYRENLVQWSNLTAYIPGEFPELIIDDPNNEGVPPPGFDYEQHKQDINAQSLDVDAVQARGAKSVEPIKRHTRSREEIYKELDPRLVEGATHDSANFQVPCDSCNEVQEED